MRFETKLRVRFAHVDPARIAFYPRYFEWFHDAFEDFFEEATGSPYAHILQARGIGFPAVQVATEFVQPARFGEVLRIEVYLSRLTARSATFEYRVWRDEARLASASIKVVGMDMAGTTARAFPEDLHAALARYVEAPDALPDTDRLRG